MFTYNQTLLVNFLSIILTILYIIYLKPGKFRFLKFEGWPSKLINYLVLFVFIEFILHFIFILSLLITNIFYWLFN